MTKIVLGVALIALVLSVCSMVQSWRMNRRAEAWLRTEAFQKRIGTPQ